jgi:hypothetical protein
VRREEAESLLGLIAPYDTSTLRDRWRRAAREHHPDRGGSNDVMARLNEAYAILMDASSEATNDISSVAADDESVAPTRNDPVIRSVDRPAFVIDALPAVAFESLLLAARILGEVVDDDPPYALEVLIEHAGATTWCRLDLVPDAGSSTVSITSDGRASIDTLCHLWVTTVNELGFVQ